MKKVQPDYEIKTLLWNSVSVILFLTFLLFCTLTVPGNQCYIFGNFSKTKPAYSFPILCHSILHWHLQTFYATWEDIYPKMSHQCKCYNCQELWRAQDFYLVCKLISLPVIASWMIGNIRDSWVRDKGYYYYSWHSRSSKFTVFSLHSGTPGHDKEQP